MYQRSFKPSIIPSLLFGTLKTELELSAGSNRTGTRGLSSRGSTATNGPSGPQHREPSATALQAYTEAQAWLLLGEYLAQHGQYSPAKASLSVSAITSLLSAILGI